LYFIVKLLIFSIFFVTKLSINSIFNDFRVEGKNKILLTYTSSSGRRYEITPCKMSLLLFLFLSNFSQFFTTQNILQQTTYVTGMWNKTPVSINTSPHITYYLFINKVRSRYKKKHESWVCLLLLATGWFWQLAQKR
jgi:hypothetical protein